MKTLSEDNGCPIHPTSRIVGKCIACGKPVCEECRKLFGYFCSLYCKELTKQVMPKLISDDEKQKKQKWEREIGKTLHVSISVILVLLGITVAYFVYSMFISSSGKVRWRKSVPMSYGISEPVVSSGVVQIINGKTLLGLSDKTGEEVWKLDAKMDLKKSIVSLNNRNGLIWGSSGICCYDAVTGEIIWEFMTKARIIKALVTRNMQFAFIEEKRKDDSNEYFLTLISTVDGKIIKRRKINFFGRPVRMFVSSNRIFLVSRQSTIYDFVEDSVNNTGNVNKKQIERIMEIVRYKVKKPAADYLKSYIAETLVEDWNTKFEGDFSSKIELFDNVIVVRTSNGLYGISENGNQLWKWPASGIAGYFGNNKHLFILAGNGRLIALNILDGSEIWSKDGLLVYPPVAVSGGQIYLNGLIPGKKKKKRDEPSVQLFPYSQAFEQFTGKEIGPKPIPCIYVLDEETGELLWKRKGAKGKFLFSGGKVYIADIRGTLNLLDAGRLISMKTTIQSFGPKWGWRRWRTVFMKDCLEMSAAENGLYLINYESSLGPDDLLSPSSRNVEHEMDIVAVNE
ncbi:MAG: PQQ-binding-like beta-propeller repeat protein [Candidatus Theseobacter exili]|nr:PQQ-binding-like beta-propeller repeat protein [Candidatus Theseobacter exili]